MTYYTSNDYVKAMRFLAFVADCMGEYAIMPVSIDPGNATIYLADEEAMRSWLPFLSVTGEQDMPRVSTFTHTPDGLAAYGFDSNARPVHLFTTTQGA